jgi:uncharacterized membrane protein YidH (DUF202 family)
MRHFSDLDKGMFMITMFLLITCFCGVYFAYEYIDISLEIGKVEPLDYTDKIIILAVILIVALIIFKALYILFLSLKNWRE